MKILPIHNNYFTQNSSAYFNTNNYQNNNIILPMNILSSQKSSSLLKVRNNLINETQQMQQQTPKIQNIPYFETNFQNIQTPTKQVKSAQKIIRIQRKIFKRNISPQILSSLPLYKNMNVKSPSNTNQNFISNNTNFNNNKTKIIYNSYNSKNDLPLMNVSSNQGIHSNEYEITSPVKNGKIIPYITLNLVDNSNKNYPKTLYKRYNTNNDTLYNYNYPEYKKYNNNNMNMNNNTNNNINYMVPNKNNPTINNIYETKFIASKNDTPITYYKNSNNNNNYNNFDYYNTSYTERNNITNNLYNTYFGHMDTNYSQTNYNNNQNNNNLPNFQMKITSPQSSTNIRYNNNYTKKNNNINQIPIEIKNGNISRSVSLDNIRKNQNVLNNIQLSKNEFTSPRNFTNITIIKDPMLNNQNKTKNENYYNYPNKINNNTNYFKQEFTPHINAISETNNNINNNYNINFNININQDYTNTNTNQNDKTNVNNNIENITIKQPQLEPSSNFNLLEFVKIGLIGRGTEGIIYSVKWKKNNKKYALKKGTIKHQEVVQKRQEEINMLKEFRKRTGSDGVINVYGYLCLKNKHNTFDFYEIMELADVDWEQEIERRSRSKLYYPENELMNIWYQIVQTFSLLQKNHITHRDIKPQNIIVINKKYKIIDFCNSRILKRDGLVIQRIRGSEMYMSPVMFKAYHSKMPRVKHNTFKSDVFSLGMCFLLAAGLSYIPLNDIREEYNYNVVKVIIRNFIGNRYSENIYSILLSMLQTEENPRPDFIELENMFKRINGYI